jgi:ATP-binding cassette subfamily C protein CydC
VLLVDEPAEHLDPGTADALVRDLLDLRDSARPRGLVLATHRLGALRQVDEVIVLDAGGVIARGTHDALLRTCTAYRVNVAAEGQQDLTAPSPDDRAVLEDDVRTR